MIFLIVIFLFLITIGMFFLFLVLEKICWVLGAIETHSSLFLKIEALRGVDGNPLELLWGDPTIRKSNIKHEHGEKIDLKSIYFSIPQKDRKIKRTLLNKIKDLL